MVVALHGDALELTELQLLIDMLRANGVKRYACAGIELELNDTAPPKAVAPDLSREGFVENADGRDPALQKILDRLDPIYSDAALFSFK